MIHTRLQLRDKRRDLLPHSSFIPPLQEADDCGPPLHPPCDRSSARARWQRCDDHRRGGRPFLAFTPVWPGRQTMRGGSRCQLHQQCVCVCVWVCVSVWERERELTHARTVHSLRGRLSCSLCLTAEWSLGNMDSLRYKWVWLLTLHLSIFLSLSHISSDFLDFFFPL